MTATWVRNLLLAASFIRDTNILEATQKLQRCTFTDAAL